MKFFCFALGLQMIFQCACQVMDPRFKSQGIGPTAQTLPAASPTAAAPTNAPNDTTQSGPSCQPGESKAALDICLWNSFLTRQVNVIEYLKRQVTCRANIFDCGSVKMLFHCLNDLRSVELSDSCWSRMPQEITIELQNEQIPCSYDDIKHCDKLKDTRHRPDGPVPRWRQRRWQQMGQFDLNGPFLRNISNKWSVFWRQNLGSFFSQLFG